IARGVEGAREDAPRGLCGGGAPGLEGRAARTDELESDRRRLHITPRKHKAPATSSGAFESRHRRNCTRSGIGDQGRLGAEERTRTSTGLPPPDPESGVSTNSTTSAGRQ